MHIIALIVTVLVGLAFWYSRLIAAREASETLADAANDVRLAAKRFAYRRRIKTHPLDSVDDARIAVLGIIAAMIQMDHLWDKDTYNQMVRQAQSLFHIDAKEATEMTILAKWLSDQSHDRDEVVRRLGRRLRDMAGQAVLPELERLITVMVGADGTRSESVEEAQAALVRALRG